MDNPKLGREEHDIIQKSQRNAMAATSGRKKEEENRKSQHHPTVTPSGALTPTKIPELNSRTPPRKQTPTKPKA